MTVRSDAVSRYEMNARDLRTMASAEKDLKLSRALSLLAEDYEAMAVTQGAIDRANAGRTRQPNSSPHRINPSSGKPNPNAHRRERRHKP